MKGATRLKGVRLSIICICLFCRVAALSTPLGPAARFDQGGAGDDALSGPMNGSVEDLILNEMGQHEYAKIVRQYDHASASVKSSSSVQYHRAWAQCEYDVPGGLRFIRSVLKSHSNSDEYMTDCLCWIALYKGKFPRDQRIAFDIAVEFARVTRHPSQAVAFRARVEDLCGRHRRSRRLLEDAKRLWDSESHVDLRENPDPTRPAGGVG